MQEGQVRIPTQPITGFFKFPAKIRDLTGTDGRCSFFHLQAGVNFCSIPFGFGDACNIWGNNLRANGAFVESRHLRVSFTTKSTGMD